MSQHGGGCAGIAGTQPEYFFAHGIVGAAPRRDRGICVSAGPRLDARVQVHRSFLPTELDQGDARDFDGDVHKEVTASQQWVEDTTEILACQRFLDDFHAKFLGLLETALVRRHDRDAIRSDADMAQHQWQDALPDAAEADEQNAPGKFDVNFVFAHDAPRVQNKRPRACRVRLSLSSAADRSGRTLATPRRAPAIVPVRGS